MKLKWSLGLLAALSLSSQANVIITEYVEGGGYNKAIEITNIGSTTVNLGAEGYTLDLHTNGASSASKSTELFGTLPANTSIVIYNKGLTSASNFPSPKGIANSEVINHNGDDTYVLKKAGAVIDSFGQVGVDPGSYWGTSDDNTKDHTLRRVASVTSGDTDPNDAFDPNNGEWQFFDKDTLDGLGCSGVAACTGNEPQPEAEGGAPEPDTCLFTSCSPITKAAKIEDYNADTYYANALAAIESDTASFIQAIHTDIKAGHVQLTYNQVWTALIETDQDPENADNVILLYTGKSVAKGDNASVMGNAPDSWNREHVWSKSHGFPDSDQLGYTDIHHLRPADASINTLRSNYDFDNGGDVAFDGDNATGNNVKSGTSWEPRDEVKGDVARMMFYMAVRYQEGSDTNMPNLKLVDIVGSEGAEFGKLCSMYEWHKNDVVDVFEQNRNNLIYEFQGNRNPFVDNPDWVQKVFGARCNDGPVTMPEVSVEAVTANENTPVTLTATTNVEGLTYAWSQTAGTSVTLTTTDAATLTFTAPGVSATETLTFSVTVTDTQGNSATATVDVTVNDVKLPAEEPEEKDSGGPLSPILLMSLAAGVLWRRK